jgi:putative heme-binding domain-containing protein
LAVAQAAPDSVAKGRATFRSNCAFCHGATATGGRGPNLLGQLSNGDRDEDIERVVKNGIPGTGMPRFRFAPDELRSLVQYIQSLRKGSPAPPHPGGDKLAGAKIYATHGCSGCHEIGNQGSVFGPNLTRVGAARSYEYLKESVLNPSADVPEDFQGVTVVTADDHRYTGIRINEDTFTLQLRTPDDRFRSFEKTKLKQLRIDKASLMPPYRFSDEELKNLLAYLSSLRGPVDANAGTPHVREVR